MVKMQPYVKKWYDYMEEGRVMGLKCDRCGSYEFPPVTVCNNCAGTNLSWIEMSGEGKLAAFSLAIEADPPFADFAPFIYGAVVLKEGPTFHSMILGWDIEDQAGLYKRLPIAVRSEIQDRGDHKFVVFRVAE
jgi:uncharacterized OB-fold protein